MKSTSVRGTMISLTKANLSDVDFIIKLESKAENSKFIIPYTKSRHIDNINSSDYEYLIINYEAGPVGYIINKIDFVNHALEIVRIVIDRKGLGLGKASLLSVIQRYLSMDYKKIWLDVFSDNIIANALYTKIGFVKNRTFLY